MKNLKLKLLVITILCITLNRQALFGQDKVNFKVIAFYTAKNDQAHISFVHEANKWFPAMAQKYHFSYDSTQNWNNLNAEF